MEEGSYRLHLILEWDLHGIKEPVSREQNTRFDVWLSEMPKFFLQSVYSLLLQCLPGAAF